VTSRGGGQRPPARINRLGDPGVSVADGWIIVASRKDEDVIDFLLTRAQGKVQPVQVLWAERGPIRFYSNSEELRRDLPELQEGEAPVLLGTA
jgi:hypothetical protein